MKDVINYAKNPNKTTDRKYLDKDLAVTLKYVEDGGKTDRMMYVSGINCPKKRAYEQMMTTKRRYGKLGGNVAYHGYQSFQSGEVTPEEAHRIGIETAKRMWGDDYEIVVTTHLNTNNIHNHFVVNSVSFKTGRKFENHISDHYKLREISDKVCIEYGKSVLENAQFYSGAKKDYWLHKDGKLSHRDMLKKDIDEAISNTVSAYDFKYYLECLGYRFVRDFRYEHPSIIAPSWQKSVRLDSLGKNYTKDAIGKRLHEQYTNVHFQNFQPPSKQRKPYLLMIYDYSEKYKPDMITALFDLFIQIIKICKGDNIENRELRPISPAMRAEIRNLDRTLEEYHFLCDHNVESTEEFLICRDNISEQIKRYETGRQKLRNKIRRVKPPEDDLRLKSECMEFTKKLTPLRKQLKICNRIEGKYPRIKELLNEERLMEMGKFPNKNLTKSKQKDRGYER